MTTGAHDEMIKTGAAPDLYSRERELDTDDMDMFCLPQFQPYSR